jgi:hypothetical protein
MAYPASLFVEIFVEPFLISGLCVIRDGRNPAQGVFCNLVLLHGIQGVTWGILTESCYFVNISGVILTIKAVLG